MLQIDTHLCYISESFQNIELSVFIRCALKPRQDLRCISPIQMQPAQKCIYVRNQLRCFFFTSFPKSLHHMKCLFQILTNQIHPAKESVCYEDLFDLSSTFRLHPPFLDQCHHLIIILSFFQITFCQCQRNQPFSVLSKHKFYDFPKAYGQFSVPAAPLAEVFSSIHHRGQIAGYREFRDVYFPVGDQDTCRPQQLRHSADATMGKGNIQRDQPSSGFPCITSLCPFLIFFQFMIPALTFIHIHKNRLQQAHSHHKYRILPDQILRKLQIIISQFIIITDSCIFPGIRHQQPEDTVCIIVYLVHFQCFGNLALHLIIQTCVIIQTADLFRRAFFMQPLFHRPAHGILATPDTVFFPHFCKKIAGFHPLCQHMLHMFVSGDHRRQTHRKILTMEISKKNSCSSVSH